MSKSLSFVGKECKLEEDDHRFFLIIIWKNMSIVNKDYSFGYDYNFGLLIRIFSCSSLSCMREFDMKELLIFL